MQGMPVPASPCWLVPLTCSSCFSEQRDYFLVAIAPYGSCSGPSGSQWSFQSHLSCQQFCHSLLMFSSSDSGMHVVQPPTNARGLGRSSQPHISLHISLSWLGKCSLFVSKSLVEGEQSHQYPSPPLQVQLAAILAPVPPCAAAPC